MSKKETYRVRKMRHPGTGRDKDRSTVIYSSHITISNIPEAVWGYVVNGKPALAWLMERQCVKTDRASGIVSDANRYAIETVGDPRYPLDLFLRVSTVSLETMRIVRVLPGLEIKLGDCSDPAQSITGVALSATATIAFSFSLL